MGHPGEITAELRFPLGVKEQLMQEIVRETEEVLSCVVPGVVIASSVNKDITVVHCRLVDTLPTYDECNRVADLLFERCLKKPRITLMLEVPRYDRFFRGKQYQNI